jgi:hypothetical protein
LYDEPIYELTEENFSEKLSPGQSKLSPKGSSLSEKFNNTLFTNTMNKGRKLLVITIEVGNGRQEQLIIYESDDPQKAAEEFCNKHSYDRELRDMLQYQIECTIYEAKSKLLQKERSKLFTTMSASNDFEIPLEITYSENGVYSKLTPKNELSTIPNNTYEEMHSKEDAPLGLRYSNQKDTPTKNVMLLKDEEKVEEYEIYPGEGQEYSKQEDAGVNIALGESRYY